MFVQFGKTVTWRGLEGKTQSEFSGISGTHGKHVKTRI